MANDTGFKVVWPVSRAGAGFCKSYGGLAGAKAADGLGQSILIERKISGVKLKRIPRIHSDHKLWVQNQVFAHHCHDGDPCTNEN